MLISGIGILLSCLNLHPFHVVVCCLAEGWQLQGHFTQLPPFFQALVLFAPRTPFTDSLQTCSTLTKCPTSRLLRQDGSDLVELHGTDVAATVWEGKAFLTQAFQNWTKSATKELLDQVSSKERELLETWSIG